MLKRIVYFFYYLKNLDRRRFKSFVKYAENRSPKSKLAIYFNVFYSSLKYNISILEYFQFRFFELSEAERKKYAGTGAMYEYQLKMNPPNTREKLENKTLFLKHYRSFIKREYFLLDDIKKNPEKLHSLLKNASGKIVVKLSTGQVGAEVKVLSADKFTPEKLLSMMEKDGFDLVEEFVVQHPRLMELSPSGLNTIRLITELRGGAVHFLGASLRISINSSVDNLAAGNTACPIDLQTGKLSGPGIYSDITKTDLWKHPVSKVELVSFQIPFWQEAIEMVKNAALFDDSNRSIGWDVAISKDGPELIEGNHNWCKLLWQLPVKKGMKAELEKYV